MAIDDEGFVLSVHWISWTRSAQTKSDRVVSLPLHSTILEAVLDYLYEDHTAKVLSLSLSLTHTVVLACLVFFWNAFQIDQHCPFGPIAVPFGATSLIN